MRKSWCGRCIRLWRRVGDMPSHTVLDSRGGSSLHGRLSHEFPAITVGLAVFLCINYAMYLRTRDPVYLQIYRFWKKIFAVGFALGVVAGIVLTFEFGLNWGVYAHDVGPIIGVIIGMEVVTAFFLEAGFIGIMLLGKAGSGEGDHVREHHGGLGHLALDHVDPGRQLVDADAVRFRPGPRPVPAQGLVERHLQPRFPPSVFPMLAAVLIAATWLIAGISAFYLARGRYRPFSRRTFSIAMGLLAILLPWQLFIGDNVASTMFKYQPDKLITLEGNYNSQNSGYNVFAIFDPQAGKDIFQITIPNMGSLVGPHVLSGQAKTPGINTIPKNMRPNVYLLFWGFRAMFYSALIMFSTAMVGLYLRLRRTLYTSRRFLRWVTWTTPIGVIAIIGGWINGRSRAPALGRLRATLDRQCRVASLRGQRDLLLRRLRRPLSALAQCLDRLRRAPGATRSRTDRVAGSTQP